MPTVMLMIISFGRRGVIVRLVKVTDILTEILMQTLIKTSDFELNHAEVKHFLSMTKTKRSRFI